VVCQPRRLAAITVAQRIADEQAREDAIQTGEIDPITPTTGKKIIGKVGGRVGYMIKGETKVSGQTRILFCTYGVLLRRLQVH
jgi:HrpA-like RNA helicase